MIPGPNCCLFPGPAFSGLPLTCVFLEESFGLFDNLLPRVAELSFHKLNHGALAFDLVEKSIEGIDSLSDSYIFLPAGLRSKEAAIAGFQ